MEDFSETDRLCFSQFAQRGWYTAPCSSPLRLTPQARHELARSCIGRNLLSLLLPTTTTHILGVQDEDSRVECDEMA